MVPCGVWDTGLPCFGYSLSCLWSHDQHVRHTNEVDDRLVRVYLTTMPLILEFLRYTRGVHGWLNVQ